MTPEQISQVISGFDMIAKASGQQSISDVINQFVDKIPKEYRDIVVAQVKEEAAKAIAEGIEQTTAGMSKAADDPDLLNKLKAMGPQDDSQ